KKLLNEITNVIGSATQILDLTFLYNPAPGVSAFPDRDFQEAICKGFAKLITSGRRPSIRILFGVPFNAFWRRYFPFVVPGLTPKGKPRHKDAMESEKRWLKETIEYLRVGKPPVPRYKRVAMKCPILVAHGDSTSWNHTKIIVADDKIAITGGHNCYDNDYLGAPPTHDVSGVFEGPAAKAARLFCDKLWTRTAGKFSFSLINGNFHSVGSFPKHEDIYRQMPIPGTPGHLEMLSLGRLGKGFAKFSISSNASVSARVVALCKAKNTIMISQQSLRAILGDPLYDFYTCLAIVRAVKAGVNVQVVLTGQHGQGYGGEAQKVLQFLQLLYLYDVLPPDSMPLSPLPGYARGWLAKCQAAPSRESINEWVNLAAGSDAVVLETKFVFALLSHFTFAEFRKKWNVDAHIAKFNEKLKLATLYYSDNAQSSNHAKVYIIGNLEQYSLSAISVLAERAVAALVPR